MKVEANGQLLDTLISDKHVQFLVAFNKLHIDQHYLKLNSRKKEKKYSHAAICLSICFEAPHCFVYCLTLRSLFHKQIARVSDGKTRKSRQSCWCRNAKIINVISHACPSTN